jgi:hypothetical protein
MSKEQAEALAKSLTDLRIYAWVGSADAVEGAVFESAPGCEETVLTLPSLDNSAWGVQYNGNCAAPGWACIALGN